jgi:hypothetical protein
MERFILEVFTVDGVDPSGDLTVQASETLGIPEKNLHVMKNSEFGYLFKVVKDKDELDRKLELIRSKTSVMDSTDVVTLIMRFFMPKDAKSLYDLGLIMKFAQNGADDVICLLGERQIDDLVKYFERST